LRRNAKLWLLGIVLTLVHLLVIGAGFVSPYDPSQQNRDFPLAPATRLHFVDSQGRFHLRPFVCTSAGHLDPGSSSSDMEDCRSTSPLRFFVKTDENQGTSYPKPSWHLFGVDAPAKIFLLGTDDYGRDQFSRLLHGGQISLGAGFLAAGLSLAVGLLFGCMAGYSGSWVDALIMRGTELFMALPWIYLLFAVRAFLPLHLGARQSFLLLIGIIGLTGWARPSRLIRGVVLSATQRNYVLAARGFGASSVSIVRRHILPEVSSIVLTQAALLVPQYILAEITFSFLGLGVGEPEPSWGNLLASMQTYAVLEGRRGMLASALALVPIFLLFYLFADALQRRFQFADLSK
jgi:peptide/nickel transport system permease protein